LAFSNEADMAASAVGLAAPALTPCPFQIAAQLSRARFGRDLTVNPPPYDPARFDPPPYPPVRVLVYKSVHTALLKNDVDVALAVRVPHGLRPPGRDGMVIDGDHPFQLDWELYYFEHLGRSRETVAYLEQHASLGNARQLQWVLAGHAQTLPAGQESDVKAMRAVPVAIARKGLVVGERTPSVSMSAIVPLILILMTITGAVYPAIDLTAGERERGTLEILVAAPVPRLALLFAKYIAVLAVAMLTAAINLAMMLVTLQLNGLTPQVFRQGGITIELVVQLLALLILFATFFSAVLLALTSFARSFKEAQAYLIPLMLVSLGPGVFGMMPGLRLQGALTVTPLMNIVLLARDLAEGRATISAAAAVIVSTLVYAGAAIAVAARVFGAEAVLFSEQKGWADLFHRPTQRRPTASLAGALLCLALVLPIHFVMVSLQPAAQSTRVFYQGLGILLLCMGLPAAACWMGRIAPVAAFQLTRPPWTAWPGALLLAGAAVPAVFTITTLLRDWGLTFFDELRLTQLSAQGLQVSGAAPLTVPVVIFTLAAIGIVEELLFRGFLFSALRAHAGRRLTIVGSAFAFGLFHYLTMFDRLIPSTALGLLLGWVCWQTRSVVPGMLLHAAYNACLGWLLLDFLATDGRGVNPEMPVWWQIAMVPAAALGVFLIWNCKPRLDLAESTVAAKSA
jgi:ABC-2 type transport system permease protein/sodium transport system permease protein